MKKIILLLSVFTFLFSNSFFMKPTELKLDSRLDQFCHFGINNPYPFSSDYDMTLLGADSYINWSINPEPLEPQNYEQIKVIRTWDGTEAENNTYQNMLDNLPAQLASYPDAIWIIGNEPDTEYGNQDKLIPEVYAQRFLEISAIIRANDPEARIGFAPIVQPSPARIYYLERVITEMNRLLEGMEMQISDTFDLWTIHSFLLREVDEEWGTGLPTGVELDELDADHRPLELDYRYDTHSIVLFSELIINFRQWINDQGLGDKPLWITEYGSLMPTYIVPELETIEYMRDTFDFLLSSKNPVSGYAPDDRRLVQKWFWYSLNENIDTFGGTLYDRDLSQETNIGLNFRQYIPDPTVIQQKAPDFLPVAIESISPIRYAPDGILVDYLVIIRGRNNISADHNSNFLVNLFDTNDVLLGSVTASTMRCAGDGFGTMIVTGLTPGSELFNLKISVESANLPDINPENNILVITGGTSFIGVPDLLYLPALFK